MKRYQKISVLMTSLFLTQCQAYPNGKALLKAQAKERKEKEKEERRKAKEEHKSWRRSLKSNLRDSGHRSGLTQRIAIPNATTNEQLFINAFAEEQDAEKRIWLMWQPDDVTNKNIILPVAVEGRCEPALLQRLLDARVHKLGSIPDAQGVNRNALYFAALQGEPRSVAVLLKAKIPVTQDEIAAAQASGNTETFNLLQGQLIKDLSEGN